MNPLYSVIDGHAHLNELDTLEKDLAAARLGGVKAIIGVGMDLASNRRILAIAEEHPGFVFPAIGYHPCEIRRTDVEETLSFLGEKIEQCVALGEVGLDYKARVKKELQRKVFREIIALSVRYNKILILHCRYSHQRVFSMISEGGVERAVFHWYTGTIELLRNIIAAGYYITATPALQYSTPHQEAVRLAPLERILIETDCPVEYQGRESRPVDVIITLREVARIRGMTMEEIAEITSSNTKKLYDLPG